MPQVCDYREEITGLTATDFVGESPAAGARLLSACYEELLHSFVTTTDPSKEVFDDSYLSFCSLSFAIAPHDVLPTSMSLTGWQNVRQV